MNDLDISLWLGLFQWGLASVTLAGLVLALTGSFHLLRPILRPLARRVGCGECFRD